jgi:hypothetical protein
MTQAEKCEYVGPSVIMILILDWQSYGSHFFVFFLQLDLRLNLDVSRFLTNSVAQEPEGSSPHSQQPANSPCPEPVESNPHPPNQYP